MIPPSGAAVPPIPPGSMMTEAMAHTRRALDAHYNNDASLK